MTSSPLAEAASVHTLACYPVANYGTDAQRKRYLPDMVGGEMLGAYCLSEPQGGSDAAALTTRATRDGEDFVVSGTKAWITHAGLADFYNVFCRTGEAGARGISCLLMDASTAGIAPQPRERLVLTVEMGVAVDQDDLARGFRRQFFQLLPQAREAVAREGEERVRLHQDHKASALFGSQGGVVEPRQHGLHPQAMLRVTHVVVVAGDVERDEHPAAGFPALVLAELAGCFAKDLSPSLQT